MRKTTNFFILLLAFVSGSLPLAAKNGSPLSDEGGPGGNCTLPAPSYITWNFPTASTVNVVWEPVGGAWGYHIDWTDNTAGGTTTYTTQNLNIVLGASLGHVYTFAVKPMCDPLSISPNTGIAKISNNILITDVLTENPWHCLGSLDQLPDLDMATPETFEFIPVPDMTYYIHLVKAGLVYSVQMNLETSVGLMHRYSLALEAGTQNTSFQCTQSAGQTGCYTSTLSHGEDFCNFRVFSLYSQANPDNRDQLLVDNHGFESYGVYKCIQSKGSYSPSSDRSEDIQGNPASVVSPFHDYLQISFDQERKAPKSVALLDLNGRTMFQKTLPEQDIFAGQLQIPTVDYAPGLYLLQIRNADGRVETHKVVKE